MRCTRCGIESALDPCAICKREGGIVGEDRLRHCLEILQDKYGDRKRGFSLGEGQNALPYNFNFTSKILDKLYNFNILEKKTVQNSVRYEFTGRTLDSNYNIKPPVEEIKKRFEKPEKQCKTVKYDDEIIREALILYDDGNNVPEIKTLLDKAYGVIIGHAIIQGWIDDFNDGFLILNDNDEPKETGKVQDKPDETKKVEVVKVAEKTVNKYNCKYCGISVRAHHIACRKCRPQWLEELFNQIKPLFEENEFISRDDIADAWGKNSSSIHKVVEEIIALKWLNKTKNGVYVQYSLPGKVVAEDNQEKVHKINELKSEIKAENIIIENSGLPEVQRMLKDGIKEPEEWISQPKNISTKLPSSIELITDLLPSLIFATIITIEPGDKRLNANFNEQKMLLDLYEILPNQLKSLVKLRIDPESPIQKISIPLEW